MPTDYITRLVLDNKHKSLIGVKDNKVIGGITFKCFERENMTKFIEVWRRRRRSRKRRRRNLRDYV
jgi:hypothetical protein